MTIRNIWTSIKLVRIKNGMDHKNFHVDMILLFLFLPEINFTFKGLDF